MIIKEFIQFVKEKLSSLYPLEESNAIAIKLLVDLACCKKYDHLINPDKTLKEIDNTGEIESLLMFAVERLAQGEPLQYILGFEWFYGEKYNVSKDVLIPRPETEELVDLIIKKHTNFLSDNFSVLDICTGSGCIIHSLALNIKQGNYYGCDISNNALEIAKTQNLYKDKDNKPHFFWCDILKLEAKDIIIKLCKREKFDLIVSNPPYVCESEKSLMRKNVLNYEPNIALFVPDKNPLIFYEKIITLAKDLLKPNGELFFEINEKFGQKLFDILSDNNFKSISIIDDINKKNRFLEARFV